jgi:hypothetical protein
MTVLVKRLRSHAADGYPMHGNKSIFTEAADEIERLTDRAEAAEKDRDYWHDAFRLCIGLPTRTHPAAELNQQMELEPLLELLRRVEGMR